MAHADPLKERMRSLRPSVFIEVTFQKNVGCFVDVKSRDSREWNGFYLLKMKTSRTTYEVFDPGSTQFIWGGVVWVKGASMSCGHVVSP